MASALDTVSGIQNARDAGYSPDEIYDHLAKQPDYAKAKESGYSFDEVYQHLYSKAQEQTRALQEQSFGVGSPIGSMMALLRGDLKADHLTKDMHEFLDSVPPEVGKQMADTINAHSQEEWEKQVGPEMAVQLKQHYAQRAQGVSDLDQPLFYLPKPKGDGAVASLTRGVEQSAEGLATMKNIGILAATPLLPKPLQAVVAKGFLAMMAYGAAEEGATALDPTKTKSERLEAAGRGLTNAALLGLGAKAEFGRPAEGGALPETRAGGMTPEQADAAATQNQLRALAPETLAESDPKMKSPPELLDGLTLARKKLTEGFASAPVEQQKVRQMMIDHIDDTLLSHDRDAVNESAARTAQPQPPTDQPAPGATEEVQGGPSSQLSELEQLKQQIRGGGAPLTAEALPPEPVAEPAPAAEAAKPAPLVGPAMLSDGEIVAKGEIGQKHADLIKGAVSEGNVDAIIGEHGFHDADGKPLSRTEAADRALATGQIAQILYDKAMARKGASNKGLHSEDLISEKPEPQFVLPKRAEVAGDQMVNVNVGKFDVGFSKDPQYIGKGEEDISGRRKAFEDFQKTGKPIETPEVSVDPNGKVTFINGRHRYSVLRDQEIGEMPIAMSEESAANARKNGLLSTKEGLTEAQQKISTDESTPTPKPVSPESPASENAVSGDRTAAGTSVEAKTPAPGEKLAEDLRKLGRVNRDSAEAVAKELKYYSDEELAQLQEHLGTADAEPDTLAQAITGKGKIKETSRPSDYVNEPAGKEGRGHPTADVAKEAFGEDYMGGPGAMGPREAEALKQEQATTGLKKATVLTERLSRGEEPLPPAERQSETEAVSRALETQTRDPKAPQNLVSRILDQGDTAISRDDAALLLVERNRVLEDMRQADGLLKNESASDLERTEAQANLKDLETQIDRLDRAQKEAGSQWGRVGRMYQQMIREDYTLDGIQRRMRTAKGGPLNEAERTQSEELATKMEEATKTQEAAEAEKTAVQEAADLKYYYEQTIKDLQKEVAKAPKISKPILDAARGFVDKLNTRADAARVRLRERLSQASAGIDPTIVLDVAEIMAAHIGEIGLKSAEVSARVLAEFGDSVKPYLNKAWEQARKIIDGLSETPEVKTAVKKGIGAKEKTTADVSAKAKAEATAGEGLSNQTVYELARAHIKAGIHGEDAVMAAVHKDIKEAYPSATERDVRRAFSDYGKTKLPSQEAVAKELRELRTLTRLQESIDRLKEGQDALKTGPQRDKATQEIREKQKQLNELLKTKQGPPSPEKLASQEAAKITALENRIADIDKELRTGDQPPKGTKVPDSSAVEQLKAERDAMIEKRDEIRKSLEPKPTAEEIAAKQAQDSLDSALVSRERWAQTLDDISTGKLDAKSTEGKAALTQLEEDVRLETEGMKRAAAELKREGKPVKPEAQKQLVSLQKQRDTLRKILSGEIEPKKAKAFEALSTEAENVQAEIQAMRELQADLKRAPGKTPEEITADKAQQAVDRAAEALDRQQRINSGEITPDPKEKVQPLSELEKELRDRTEELRKAKRDAERATPEERYNETRMKQILKREAELKEQLKTGNFEKVKPTPPPKDAKVAAAEARMTELKREVEKAVEKKKYEQLSPQQKFFKEAMSTFRSITAIKILGHGAVGMVTHAGGVVFRPTKATIYWRNFGRQFGMWHNKAYHEQLVYRLKNDPEYETWKKAGASIDPEKTYTDYGMYAQWLGKLGEKGARGFDALKLVRMEMNKADWSRVPEEIKADPKQADAARKLIAEINNKATGATPKTNPMGKGFEEGFYGLAKNPILEAAFFAPRLYASRWGRVLFDPVKTARVLFDPKSSPAETFAAKLRVRNAAEFTGTLIAALLTNQAILSATGSNQNVNLTNPKKSDWLKFKVGGKVMVADGGLLDPVRLMGQVIWKDLLEDRTKQQQYREGSRYKEAVATVGNYLRGKLNPPVGLAADVATGSDFQGRPLPFSKEKPLHKDQTPYEWGEWLLSQGPIPMAGATKELTADLKEKGFKDREIQVILKGIASFGLGMAGVHVGEDYNAQPKTGGGATIKLKRR